MVDQVWTHYKGLIEYYGKGGDFRIARGAIVDQRDCRKTLKLVIL